MNDTFEIEYEISIEDIVEKKEATVTIYQLDFVDDNDRIVYMDFVQAVSYVEDVLLYDEIGYDFVDNAKVTNIDHFLKWVKNNDGSDFIINYEINLEDQSVIPKEVQISRIEFDADTRSIEDFLIVILDRDIRKVASTKFLNVDDFEEWHEKISDTDLLYECR